MKNDILPPFWGHTNEGTPREKKFYRFYARKMIFTSELNGKDTAHIHTQNFCSFWQLHCIYQGAESAPSVKGEPRTPSVLGWKCNRNCKYKISRLTGKQSVTYTLYVQPLLYLQGRTGQPEATCPWTAIWTFWTGGFCSFFFCITQSQK